MTFLKILLLLASLSLVSSIPLQEAYFHGDDDQEILETLDNYIPHPSGKFPGNIDHSFVVNPGLHLSPDMPPEDSIHVKSSDSARNLFPDRSEPFFKHLEKGFMDRPQLPPRKNYALVPVTRGENNYMQEQILDSREIITTLKGLKETLSSVINYLRNQNRRRNRIPEENREAASDQSQWRDRARNVLDMVDNRLQRGGSDGGEGVGRGRKDAEMERFGLGKLVNIILRILKKFEKFERSG